MCRNSLKKFFSCLIIFFLILFNPVFANNLTLIKLALFDTVYNEMPVNFTLLSQYQRAYLAGIEAAREVAKQDGFNLLYMPFFYGNGPLDLFAEIPKIKAWQPDFVLGPSSSDQFLMLRDSLPNILVLSSYASDQTLAKMPRNFYSTFLPDGQIMNLLAGYINQKYPKKNIYIITQIDSKQCVDVADLFIDAYKKLSPKTQIVENKLILDNLSDVDIKKLVAGHQNDIIIIFNDTFYDYNVLVERIANSTPDQHFVFYSDQDNWGEAVTKTPSTVKVNYESYRIGPIMEDAQSPQYQAFVKVYANIYHAAPADAVSYMTYLSVLSVIEALHNYPDLSNKDSTREKILYSYSQALNHDPNWFRLNDFAIYQITPRGEILINSLSSSN